MISLYNSSLENQAEVWVNNSVVKVILRIEGLIVFLGALFLYNRVNYLSFSWILFLLLILLPDISMIGYLKDKKLGALIYNLGHNYILSVVLVITGLTTNNPRVMSAGLALAAHVGIDRFMGFGLKYPTNFKDTHLQKV